MATLVSSSVACEGGSAVRVGNAYGHFSPDGLEFHITHPRPPRPWANVIANKRFGIVVSHSGSGFTWVDNSQLAVITRWQQDLALDSSGKFLYVVDADSGECWSLSPAPTWPVYEQYSCIHGLGYTTFHTRISGIEARWTLFCHADQTVELWRVELTNHTDKLRRLELTAMLEWCCGVAPSPRREFHRLFLATEFCSERRAIYAQNYMWEVPSERYGHWNTDFPYVAALAATEPILSAQGDKTEFFGRYGDPRRPSALRADLWKPLFGRHEDAIAVLRSAVELRPGQRRDLGYALAVDNTRAGVDALLDRLLSPAAMDQALAEVRRGWRERLAAHRIQTPEPSLNYLVNDWVRYQAISGRLWGRCGYYQQSGAFGFRDQLQDSQVWLTIEPARCREQINLHAAHQFADGSVYHWWHPLSEQGHVTKMTDDLLWLAFVTANYIRETGSLDILRDTAPFLDDGRPHSVLDHVQRAFERVFQRTSPRGLPYIGAGDWNDGLSAVGLQERGESVWLGHFLVGLLADWAEIYRRAASDPGIVGDAGIAGELRVGPAPQPGRRGGAPAHALPEGPGHVLTRRAAEFEKRRAALIAAINRHGWDGEWYIRGTLDDGRPFGTRSDTAGRIFLNAQTWAVLNDVAPPDRAQRCMAAVREHLVSEAGALLLAPAYRQPVREVGYITRYAPGLRENGGVYSHAATWAIAAACKVRDADLAGTLLSAMNPALKDPERYWAEPYVLPGNVDGPDSPHHGRAGWTWYTGSAAWLHRVVTQWVLGVQPEWDGLRIAPCLPTGWRRAEMTRPYRGCTYRIRIERADVATLAGWPDERLALVSLDGGVLAENFVPAPEERGRQYEVHVLTR